jgi:hypothetical protein
MYIRVSVFEGQSGERNTVKREVQRERSWGKMRDNFFFEKRRGEVCEKSITLIVDF